MKHTLTAHELSNFCGQLGMLVHSGISVTESLAILLDESKSDTDRQMLTPLLESMEKTGSLSAAMEDSALFPHMVIAYTRTGEETGCLDEIMDSLCTHYEQEQAISSQIRSAVTYPFIMLGMMAVVILVLLIKVLPVFRQVFQQMGMEMNSFSNSLLNVGSIISHYSGIFLILAVLLIGCLLFFSMNLKGQQSLKKIIYRLPVLRDIPVAADYGRVAQGLSIGLKSGLSPETSLTLASEMVTHPLVLERLHQTAELLESGAPFSQALTESSLFDGMEGRMVSIAFQSGSADDALAHLSQKYQEKAIDTISGTVSVIEPTIVIILSLLVGLVLLSVMMPLLGILSDIV